MSKPGISVIIPCHNAGAYVEETVASIMAHNISGVPLEVIIIDHNNAEGSDTKKALERIREVSGGMPFPVTIATLDDKTRTPSAPRNLAIQMAQYDYICPLDADDKYNNAAIGKKGSYFDRVIDEFGKNPNLAILVGEMQKFNENGPLPKDPPWGAVPYSEKSMLFHNSIPSYGAYRREDALQAGGYDTQLDTREDQAFYLTLLSNRMDRGQGREVKKMDEEYLLYRQVPGSVHTRDPMEEKWFARVLETAPSIYQRHLPDIDWEKPVPDVMKKSHLPMYEQALFDPNPPMVRWLADFNKYANANFGDPDRYPLDTRLQALADKLDPPVIPSNPATGMTKFSKPSAMG